MNLVALNALMDKAEMRDEIDTVKEKLEVERDKREEDQDELEDAEVCRAVL